MTTPEIGPIDGRSTLSLIVSVPSVPDSGDAVAVKMLTARPARQSARRHIAESSPGPSFAFVDISAGVARQAPGALVDHGERPQSEVHGGDHRERGGERRRHPHPATRRAAPQRRSPCVGERGEHDQRIHDRPDLFVPQRSKAEGELEAEPAGTDHPERHRAAPAAGMRSFTASSVARDSTASA